MGQHALKAMTVEDYYAWGELQDDRYEFVDGFPVAMMSGANRRHDQIALNTLVAIAMRLRGRPCRAFTADTAVATGANRRRRPDAGIECGPRRDGDYVANEPRVVIEVLSPSTREFDLLGKLDEYRGVPSLREIVVIEPNAPQAMLWSRSGEGDWRNEPLSGLEATIDLASVGVQLPLVEIYDGLEFRARRELVPD